MSRGLEPAGIAHLRWQASDGEDTGQAAKASRGVLSGAEVQFAVG